MTPSSNGTADVNAMSLFFSLVGLAAVGFGPGADAEENPIRKELERRQQQTEAERAEDGFLCGKTFVTFHAARIPESGSTLTLTPMWGHGFFGWPISVMRGFRAGDCRSRFPS